MRQDGEHPGWTQQNRAAASPWLAPTCLTRDCLARWRGRLAMAARRRLTPTVDAFTPIAQAYRLNPTASRRRQPDGFRPGALR
jgi:hypothetical protein